jgi:hypothetical protein
MSSQQKGLTLEFEHYPPLDLTPEEVAAQRDKSVLEAVSSLLASHYPEVAQRISSGAEYDIELASSDDDGTGSETALSPQDKWADVADQCEKMQSALAMAEHVDGGLGY